MVILINRDGQVDLKETKSLLLHHYQDSHPMVLTEHVGLVLHIADATTCMDV
jgi:hypothetical protein